MCLAACDKAPMLQCNFSYALGDMRFENLDMEKMKAFIEAKRAELEQANKK
jgi:NADH:ubiquinone oxidoreductase subunit E